MRKLVILVALLGCLGVSNATVTLQASGIVVTDPDGMHYETPVSVQANLTISNGTLTVVLSNLSESTPYPDTLLGSFYFDIVNGSGDRPILDYQSASGDIWTVYRDGTCTDVTDVDLRAVAKKPDPTYGRWQFKEFDPSNNIVLDNQDGTYTDYGFGAGFGIGTVGNNLAMNYNFSGNWVNGMDYSIYGGDCGAGISKDATNLVLGSITFTFSGLEGYTEADIVQDAYAFGMGTSPDSLLMVPEPATLAFLGLGSLVLLRRKK